MLEYLRERSQSAVIVFIVAVISAVFIINFGPQSQGCGAEGTVWLARVYGHTLTMSDYRWVDRLIRGRYRLPREYLEETFGTDVLQGLIERELLIHEAERAGLAVGNAQVETAVLDRFQIHFSWPLNGGIPLRGPIVLNFEDEDGEVQIDDLEDYTTRGLGLSEKAFVEQQGREILAERMRQFVLTSVQLSENEVYGEYASNADRVNLEYARIYPAFFRDALRPTKQQIDDWASEHADDIEERYEADRFRYRNAPKQLRVLDIMVNLEEDASEDVTKARRERAEAILALAKADGADFGQLARCFSDDTRSATKSGDMGYVRRGTTRFGTEFDEVVFEMDDGQTSEIIQTKRGLHIVHVVDVREGDIELDQARPEIAERLYREQQGEARAREVAQAVLAQAQQEGAEFGDSLFDNLPELQPEQCPSLTGEPTPPEPAEGEEEEGAEGEEEEQEAAEQPPARRPPMAPVVRQTGFFNRSGFGVPGIGESSALMNTAFDLTEESPVAEEVIEVRENFFVVRLAENGRQQPNQEEFEEQRSQYETRMLGAKRREALRAFLEMLQQTADDSGGVERNREAVARLTGGSEETAEPDEGEEEEQQEQEEPSNQPSE